MTRQSIRAAKCRPAPVTTKPCQTAFWNRRPFQHEEHHAAGIDDAAGDDQPIVVGGSDLQDRPQDHDATPADRKIEDDGGAVETAGQKAS